MRNLKKVLALALATVMLLGMMAMASAADYADEAAIAAKYDVAVDVMNAVGVFEGDPAGNFNPNNTLTRAEAAKVIAFIGLTKANAGKLTAAAAPFADVAADHWAAGAIAYAQNMGIVKGMTETTYEPNGTLTGMQFAKMLLVTLGYKATVEGYEGAGWDINVHLDALDAGLLKGLDIELAEAITREEAAQMAFNALQANTVVYENASNIVIGNVSIQNGGTLTKKATLAAKLYPTLSKATVENKLGYSTIEWSYGTPAKVVATGTNYTVIASYAGTAAAATKDEVYEKTGAVADLPYYVNGSDTAVVGKTLTVTKAGWNDKTTAAGLGYAGALVEIVKNGDVKQVLVSDATVATVTKVTDADAAAGTARKVTFTVAGSDPAVTYTYETEEFAKDDYVLIYVANGEVAKAVAAETKTGVITKTAKGTDGKVTTLYMGETAIPVTYTTNFAPTLGEEYTVVLENGYADYIKLVTATATLDLSDYVYVMDYAPAAANGFDATNFKWAQIVTMDGKVEEVKCAYNSSLTGLVKMGESKGLKTFATITSDDKAADKFDLYTSWAGGTLDADAKAFEHNTLKAYYTAASKLMVITRDETNATQAEKVEFVALPADVKVETGADPEDMAAPIVIYTTTTAGDKEVVLVIADTTDAVAEPDLYYVVNKDLGQVYVAEAEKSYKTITAYNVFTGAKQTIMVENAENDAGYVTLTAGEYGEYALEAATLSNYNYNSTTKTGYVAVSNKDVSVYAGMMTIADTAVVDMTYADAAFVNLTGNTAVTLAKVINKTSTFTGFAYVTEGKVTAIFAEAATLVS